MLSIHIVIRFFLTAILLHIASHCAFSQIAAIDNKGTIQNIDSSKWLFAGTNIYNKNAGNVGIGISLPQAKLHVNGTVRLQGLGTSTVNTNILTTDGSGNITTRIFSDFLSNNALTSLNGLTNSIQTFATGTSGTDFHISSSGTTHTLHIPNASASSRGLLTNTDWTSFNAKLSATLNSGQIFVGNGSNIATAVTPNGDVTISNTGVTAIGTGKVTSTMILDGTVVNADLASMAGNTVKVNATATLAAPTDLALSPGNLLGRGATGNISPITLGAGLSMTGSVLNTVNSSGTVTNFSSGDLSPLFSTNVTTATTTPAQTFTLSTAAANTIFGNNTGSTAAPNYFTSASLAIAGDVTGTLGASNVVKLRGRNISTAVPTNGQVLTYNTTSTQWEPQTLSGGGSGWGLTGNSSTNPSTNFIGTTDNVDLVFKINNVESGRLNIYNLSAAFGYNASAGYKAVALGSAATTGSGTEAVSVGYNTSSQFQSIAIGSDAQTSGTEAISLGQSASSAYQAIAIGRGAVAGNNNTVAIGRGVSTSQANAFILGGGSHNVGIRTSTPNTGAALDVAGNTKIGANGTVNKNIISFTAGVSGTVPSSNNANGAFGVLDVDITIPAGTRPTSTQASVSVSLNSDLGTDLAIASARVVSTSTIRIRFINSNKSTTPTISNTAYITIMEF